MPIDYSKWDALVVSDDSDFEEAAPSANSKPVRNLPTPVKTKPPPAKTKPPESKPTSSSQSTASEKDVKKPAPQLPVELWLRIFYFNSTPLHLWSSGRRVCRLWHDWIPKIYAEKYVQNPRMTSIYFDLGTLQTGGRMKPLTLVMSFDRFDPADRKRCIFGEDKEYLRRNMLSGQAQAVMFDRWEGAMEEYLGDGEGTPGRLDLPHHIVLLKSRANDIELPNLKVDLEKHELSFEWFGMLDGFIREAAEYEQRNDKDGITVVANAQKLMYSDPKRATDMLMKFYNANIDGRKQVRRERLKRQFRGRPGLDFTDEYYLHREARSLKTIADREGEADLTLTAEDADELKRADVTQKALPIMHEEAMIADFVEFMRRWEEDEE